MAIPHIILFHDVNCIGSHKHVCQALSSLDDFNDVTSSFVILEGNWQFFVDNGFENQMGHGHGQTLGPGVYNRIETALGAGTNDRLSSLKPV